RRVVLDAQDVAALELFAADERVRALVEFESEEVGRRDEFRLARLPDERVGAQRVVAVALGFRLRLTGGRGLGARAAETLIAPLRAAQVLLLGLAPLVFADRHA